MNLGNKKGHISGPNVSGRHTTVIGVAETIVREMGKLHLFDEVRPGKIVKAGGSRISIDLKTLSNEHRDTLVAVFHGQRSVQQVTFHISGLRDRLSTIIESIQKIATNHCPGMTVQDKTMDSPDVAAENVIPPPSPEAKRLLEKYGNRNR